MNTMKTLLAAAVLMVSAQSASASDAVVNVGYTELSETVSFADLNVNKPEGAQALYKRLNRAAKNVCAPLRGRELHRANEHRSCVSHALKGAVAEVNQPLLTEHHRSRGSKVDQAIVAKR